MSSTEESPKKTYGHITTIVIHLLILGALAIAIYYPVLDKPLNNFDDLAWLKDTKFRNSFSTIFDPTLVTKNPFASTYYLPLQSALYLGMVKTFGRMPLAFHGLSIAIHALCSFLLYFLLLGFTKKKSLAFLGSFVFVAYLGHTQSITWTAAAFSHPLVSVFVLSTLLFFLSFLKTSKKAYYFGALFSFIVALLIRESAVIVPVLLIALELFYNKQEQNFSLSSLKSTLLKNSYKYIPFFLAVVPIVVISIQKFQHGSLNERWGGVGGGLHPALRFLDFSSLLVYPASLGMGLKIGLIAILLGIASWIIFNIQKHGNLFFALFWILLALAPYTISNFNPALAVTRYLYPAMLAFVLLLTLAASELTQIHTHSQGVAPLKNNSKKRTLLVYFIFAGIGCAHLFFVIKAMY